jgi:hypothetical protein
LDYHFIVDLDIYSFNSLVEAHLRLQARERIEQAQTAQLSAQGTSKALTKWLKKRWFPLLGGRSRQKAGGDAKDFLKKFGKGI